MDRKIKELSVKISGHYLDLAKKIGIKKSDLNKIAFTGGKLGNSVYAEKKNTKVKQLPYITWWIRETIHEYISQRILEISKDNPKKAKDILKFILES